MTRRRESALFRQYTEDMDSSIMFVEINNDLVKKIKQQMSRVSAAIKGLRDRLRFQYDPEDFSSGRVALDDRINDLLAKYRELREWTLPQAIFDYQNAVDVHHGDMYMGFGERDYDSEE